MLLVLTSVSTLASHFDSSNTLDVSSQELTTSFSLSSCSILLFTTICSTPDTFVSLT